jgi:metal-responsive CopG/Arc/MetJ family transcriptional regulator
MKTAVSLPDDLFRKAEAAARKLRLSRSQLYAAAIREFLERRRSSSITAHLDEIYSKETSELDQALYAAQIKSLESDSW